MNQFSPALNHYDDAIRLMTALPEHLELARTLHAKLVPLFFLGRFPELFAAAAQARQLFESVGDRRGIARLNVNLSHAYGRLDRLHESLECSEQAAESLKDLGDIEGYVSAAINSA